MGSEAQERKRLFGTNGIRGIPNADLTPDFAMDMGMAIGAFFRSSRIAIAKDTRISGDMLLAAVFSGLSSVGKNVLDLGVLPTPALQYYCKSAGMSGVMITASHNPPQFNGIKCIDSDGTELSSKNEVELESYYYERKAKPVSWEECGTIQRISNVPDIYVSSILKHADKEAISKLTPKVVFDGGNGASYFTTPLLLSRLKTKLITLNCNPDGKFTSRESEPKPENLSSLLSLMKEGNFDLGIAHDGDADRAVFIDENGKFIDGDRTLSLIVKFTAKKGDKVVTPVSSSDCISDVCEDLGAKLIRTRVGAPLVSRRMIEENATIGGEENGGVIFSRHQFCRDGAMTAALILNIMAKTRKPISQLIKELPQYFLSKGSMHIERDWNIIAKRLISDFPDREIDTMDGLKIRDGKNWVMIRPSGTEPIIRIYAQGHSQAEADSLNKEYRKKVEKANSS